MSLHARLPPLQAPVSQPPYHPNHLYESSSTSTVSPRSPGSATASTSLPSAPRSADARSYPTPGHIRPASENGPRYGSEYELTLASPGYDQYRGTQFMATSPHQSHGMSGSQLPQKRAYRQRRKDPSCDACRERKCDATDTSSCSECSSRSVKCQFTKETNRRMSSIKQVQDLEKQLFTAKEVVQRYESLLRARGLLDSEAAVQEDHDYTPGITSPNKRQKPNPEQDIVLEVMDFQLERILRPFGLDGSNDDAEPVHSDGVPKPSPEEIQAILDKYNASPFSRPQLIPPTALNNYPSLSSRDDGSFVSVDHKLVVHGCYALVSLPEDISMAQRHLKVLQDPDHTFKPTPLGIRAMVLMAITHLELNNRWDALRAMSKVYDCCVKGKYANLWGQPMTPVEVDLWNSVIWWERSIMLELGKCSKIPMQSAVLPSESIAPDSDSQRLMRISEIIGQLSFAFRRYGDTASAIPRTQYKNLCQDLEELITAPDSFRDSTFPWPDLHALSVLFIIKRHHLNPYLKSSDTGRRLRGFLAQELRRQAINECIDVASRTVAFMDRVCESFAKPDEEPGDPNDAFIKSILRGQASKVITHLWRCALVCLYDGRLSLALNCARYFSALAQYRPIGLACEEHFAVFLEKWLNQTIANGPDQSRTENGAEAEATKEELLIYASGDMQENADQRWTFILPREGETPKRDTRTGETYASNWGGILQQLEKHKAEQDSLQAEQGQLMIDATTAAPLESDAKAMNERGAAQLSPLKAEVTRVDSAASASGGVSTASQRMKISDLMG